MAESFSTTVHNIIVATVTIMRRWSMQDCCGIPQWQLHHSQNKLCIMSMSGTQWERARKAEKYNSDKHYKGVCRICGTHLDFAGARNPIYVAAAMSIVTATLGQARAARRATCVVNPAAWAAAFKMTVIVFPASEAIFAATAFRLIIR